jgi:hypothetical protein
MAAPVTSPAPMTSRGAKAPGIVFTALAAALAVLLIAALSPSQPPPPPVAEYAPEAVQAIKDAPADQTAENGLAGSGQSGADTAKHQTTTTTAQPAVSKTSLPPNTARVRRCVGDPPRQTEDPQSPPCVPYFEGDNGGVTSQGVTANSVRFVFPNGTYGDIQDDLIRYFNTRFEFYGRQLTLVPGGCFGGTPAEAHNNADGYAKNNLFASGTYCDIKGPTSAYYDELAAKGIVSVDSQPSNRTEKELAAHDPYEWSYLPTFDKGSAHLGNLACTLNGMNAVHGGPDVQNLPRKFGLFYNTYSNAPPPDLSSIRAALSECGIKPVEQSVAIADSSAGGQGVDQNTTQQIQSGVINMHNQNVTSIIALTHTETTKQIYAALESQQYRPEIMVSTYLFNDEDLVMDTEPADQAADTFGIRVWNKTVHVADEFWYQAVEDVDPGHNWASQPDVYYGTRNVYEGLMMLSAGVQLAGPHLTPQSFAAGLIRAKFPNPPHRNNPGKVTVGPGNHSYIEDATIVWFNPSQDDADYGTQGGFCYIDAGKRRRLGEYGHGDPGLFNQPCGRY